MVKRKFNTDYKVIVTSDVNNHKNSQGIINGYNSDDSTYKVWYDEGGYDWYNAGVLKKVGGDTITSLEEQRTKLDSQILNLKSQMLNLQSQIWDIEDKIKFIEETGLEEFDENIFKAYQVLSIIENENMTKIQKLKTISTLIPSK